MAMISLDDYPARCTSEPRSDNDSAVVNVLSNDITIALRSYECEMLVILQIATVHIQQLCRGLNARHSNTHPSNTIHIICTYQITMTEEQRINACKTAINQIYTMLRSSPQQWRNFLSLARTVIAQLDGTTFMQQATRTAEQVWMIAALQILAFKDVDNGAVLDIASWCSRQWLVVVQRDPQNVSALRGLGQMWLSRAQPALARIHASQGRSSSGGGNSSRSESATEAERRVGTADYVEARGFLQPATEYLERAVAAASNQDAIPGDLLVKVGRPESITIVSKECEIDHYTGCRGIHVSRKCFKSSDERAVFPSGFTIAAASLTGARLYIAKAFAKVSRVDNAHLKLLVLTRLQISGRLRQAVPIAS